MDLTRRSAECIGPTAHTRNDMRFDVLGLAAPVHSPGPRELFEETDGRMIERTKINQQE